jgi:KaiC/GvpD/RAD55 family RecA-like ATPase
MDSDILQISRLTASSPLGNHYLPFSLEILQAISNPHLQAIYEVWSQPHKGKRKKTLEDIEEDLLTRLGKNEKQIRLRTGDYSVLSPTATLKTLDQLRAAQCRISQENIHEGEIKFRTWLERAIIQYGALSEPNTLATEDPLSQCITKLENLRKYPTLGRMGEEEITFPLASQKLEIKPKTPTGILPFDEVELEGGAEEDTVLILSGESNIGKSHLGLYCLSSLSLRRETVLLCSGEDSIETTRKRIFAHYLRKPVKTILEMTEKDRLDIMRSLYGHEEDPESLHHHIIHNMALTCIPEGQFSPSKVQEKIDAVEQKTQKKVRAFLCDYLQKMDENKGQKNPKRMRDEELENIVNQIKETCQERKTFGILVSQVPSHAAGGMQEFLNLKQAVARSYAATWGAHYIITMNRPIEETKRLAVAQEDKSPRLNLFLCKNKDGPLGVCYALGLLKEARWEFFRNKIELEKDIETRKIQNNAKRYLPTR